MTVIPMFIVQSITVTMIPTTIINLSILKPVCENYYRLVIFFKVNNYLRYEPKLFFFDIL